MKKTRQPISLLLSSLFLVLSIPAVHADSFVDSQDRSKPEPVTYVEIFADTEGETHFRESSISLTTKSYAPPAIPLAVSSPQKARAVAFLSVPPGWIGDWHPAPAEQFIFILSGNTEVEVSDGEIRQFAEGDIVLAADTTGKGHITRTVGTKKAVLAAVPLAK
ncbi:cupin domain-containing protein [Amphritea sp. HPY]|uniref:cupin domain-containing protein n=1 Tax=Amphritea sp. HPY TaxID=3421652 RepID=UPI003D7E9536